LQLVHGAVVGYPNAGVLLAGPGGAGKSTVALACVEDGMDIVGDDYCLLEGLTAWSLYSQAKLDDASMERLPDLKSLVVERDTGPKQKHILNLVPRSPAQRITVQAVVVPSIGDVTALTRTTPAKALAALAPSTLFQLPGDRKLSFHKLSALVASLPCFSLTVGALHEIPELFDTLIEKAIW
jgi:hypothetical protein